MNELVLDLQTEMVELAAIEAESIGWLPLTGGAYLHLGKPEEKEIVITVVGVPEVGMAGLNVLWVGWWISSMPLLKHQLILHPDIVSQFALDKPVTPYERRVGFSWYLCPVT